MLAREAWKHWLESRYAVLKTSPPREMTLNERFPPVVGAYCRPELFLNLELRVHE